MNQDITQLLSAYQSGQKDVLDELYPLIYNDLRSIAKQQLRRSWDVGTLCSTVLVNESYLKLLGGSSVTFADRAHFFSLASKAIRQIILNYAESKSAQKRGADWQRVTLDQTLAGDEQRIEQVIEVGYALQELDSIDPKLAQLIEMKFFAGMTEVEIAEVWGVTDRTVRRNWIKAKALLAQVLAA
jgi:RNA polymerase sigma factor (TIGR02999 family)